MFFSHELAQQLQAQEDQRAQDLQTERRRQEAERDQQERLEEMIFNAVKFLWFLRTVPRSNVNSYYLTLVLLI